MINIMLEPDNQNQYLSPYGERVFQYRTVHSKVYVSRYTNHLLECFGNDVILNGLEVSYAQDDADSNLVTFTITKGKCIADLTLILFNEDMTIEANFDGLSSGYVGIFVVYKYSHDLLPNKAKIALCYISDDGNPCDSYLPEMFRILLAAYRISRDIDGNLILSEITSLTVFYGDEPYTYDVRPLIDLYVRAPGGTDTYQVKVDAIDNPAFLELKIDNKTIVVDSTEPSDKKIKSNIWIPILLGGK